MVFGFKISQTLQNPQKLRRGDSCHSEVEHEGSNANTRNEREREREREVEGMAREGQKRRKKYMIINEPALLPITGGFKWCTTHLIKNGALEPSPRGRK